MVVLGLALAMLAPHVSFSSPVSTPLWSDHPVAAPPVPVPAPNWVELVKVLKPAVVNISTKRVESGLPDFQGPLDQQGPFQQFFKQFFDNHPRTLQSLGSGFIINSTGYILTNNHVIDKATEIHVKLADGRELPAKVIGRDPKTDLALLKVDGIDLPVIPLGDSSSLQVGAPVMAVGNPFGFEETVTTGIVSAMGRVIGNGPYDSFIQTDSAINPGNSGGPLINARGQAVGVNTAMFSQSGGSVGIGFAIPIDLAKPVVTQLAETGHVTRGWLGVTIQPLTPELAKSFGVPDAQGALIASVMDGSPAQKAGLRRGDVITAYNGRRVAGSGDLPLAVAETPIGRDVPLTVLRDGTSMTLTAKIAQLEEPQQKLLAQRGSDELGLSVESLTPAVAQQLGISDEHGVLVKGVQDDSPAANAGIQAGDVIVEVDHQPVTSVGELRRDVERHAKGAPLLVRVHRNGSSLYAAIALS
ncbi:MAG TPA: DegQ family serine endoprotease [Candidatus Methylomirabilis sp.]|nr:DegQ family serine endoprotease [Candidatus Methylomirabilis sp.]